MADVQEQTLSWTKSRWLWTLLCHEAVQGYEIGLQSFGSHVSLNLRVAECAFIQGVQSELLLP